MAYTPALSTRSIQVVFTLFDSFWIIREEWHLRKPVHALLRALVLSIAQARPRFSRG